MDNEKPMTATEVIKNQGRAFSCKSGCSGSVSFTPLHVKLMLHYYAVAEPWDQAGAPAVIDYTADLMRYGLIEESQNSGSGYSATDKGQAWVKKICSTQLPVQQWI